MRIFLLFLFLFYSAPATADLVLQKGGRMPDQMISDAWKSAKVYVPGLSISPVKFNEVPKDTKKHPVVIFLHGCGGLNKPSLRWGKILSEMGYISVLPDSYSIPGRKTYCDIKNKKTLGALMGMKVKTLRANESRVTRKAVVETSWADEKNLFLMGHSEGGAGAVFTRAYRFSGVISSGFKCGKYHPIRGKLPIRVVEGIPILFIYYKNDPWFDVDNCKRFVKNRKNARVVELEGSLHETSSNKIARKEVEEFLSKHKK